MKDQFINMQLINIIDSVNAISEHINKPEPEPKRPEPKFADGTPTDKGIVKMTCWSYSHKHYHVWTDKHSSLHEDELHATPSIKITLFECVDNNGKTEVRTETITYNSNMPYDKDSQAKLWFSQGKCAILIEQDGKAEWKPCPEIADGHNVVKEWHSFTATIFEIATIINKAINHPKWTVESNGVKMRAYRMKDGTVRVYFDDAYFLYDPDVESEGKMLTALGFNANNIQKNILHGKG